MLVTNHALSGAVVGWLAPGPPSALGAGVVSHAVLDVVPHFGVADEHLMWAAVPDGLVGLAVVGAVAVTTPRRHRWRVLAGVVGACLPDLNKPSEQFFGASPFPAAVDRWHRDIQTESRWLLPVELAVGAGCVMALRALRRRARARWPTSSIRR